MTCSRHSGTMLHAANQPSLTCKGSGGEGAGTWYRCGGGVGVCHVTPRSDAMWACGARARRFATCNYSHHIFVNY
ncbi:unnamed protein product [Euphydryas editha]|uniref:Uncharacterized protein n=1 Tax=Euphydryas editha TaxID=104508 RepID=A0AAU9VBT1_EUPED|nr:unnamed protein product [Euphydryas editha]